jgi:hypothetical protein
MYGPSFRTGDKATVRDGQAVDSSGHLRFPHLEAVFDPKGGDAALPPGEEVIACEDEGERTVAANIPPRASRKRRPTIGYGFSHRFQLGL